MKKDKSNTNLEQLEVFPLTQQNDPYLKYVPIITESIDGQVTHYVYIDKDIAEVEEYAELTHLLQTAGKSDVFVFNINTSGGLLHTVLQLIDAIMLTEATCYGSLSGTVASAGTMLALAMDDLNIGFNLEFMVHYYSGGTVGKGNELQSQADFSNKRFKELYNNIYRGFLTQREINKVVNGTDIYLTSSEVTERWHKRLDLMQKAKQEAEKEAHQDYLDMLSIELEEAGYEVTRKKKAEPKAQQ